MWYDIYIASVWLSYIAPALLALTLLYKAAEQVKANWDVPKRQLPALSWVCIRIVLGACVVLLIGRAGASYFSGRRLRADAISLSGDLISFADERQKQMPSPLPAQAGGAKDWDAYTRAVAQLCSATQNDYAQRYAPRVALLRREFARRGLTDNTLASFYAHPSDPLAVRVVGERLALLGQQLR
jgi:hypothetical protein